MLRVAKVRAGGHAYYLEVAASPGGTGIEAPGRWVGPGSAALGLHGPVEAGPLTAVLAGDYKKGRCPDLWDGRAAERIAKVLANGD